MKKIPLFKQFLLDFLFITTLVCACSTPKRSEDEYPISVAKQEVYKKWGWKKIEVKSARFVNGRWLVNLLRLPETPGGFATVEVSSNGEVIRVLPGK